MAVNPKDLTVDYKSIQAMPFRDRKALMYSGYADQVNSALTPSQRANLFPSYYRAGAAAASGGSGSAGVENLSKAEYLKRARQGGVSNSDLNRVSGKPKEKGPPEITASEFRAVESNPYLAGYADKTRRSPDKKKLDPTQFMDPRTSGKIRPEVLEKYKDRNLPVTIRNNNMGAMSLKDDSNTYVTGMEGYVGKTPRPAAEGGFYAKYATPEHGVAAASKNLENYYRKGINTPEGIVRKWARDANQNYIGTVVSYLNNAGYKINQTSQLDLSDPNVRVAILKAKSAFESGAGVPVYTDDVYVTGANYAFDKEVETAEQTATPDAMAVVEKVASETPSAVELRMSAENLDINATTESALGFLNNSDRNPDGANLGEVDGRLLELAEMGIRKFEAENPNLKVEIYGPSSGKRQSSVTQNSQHLEGKALDFEIFEVDPKTGKKTGKRLPNFRTQAGAAEAGDEYLKLHQNIELARIYKKDVVKDDRYEGVYGRSGALFGGDYALDTQHYDIGGAPAAGGLLSAEQPGGSIFGGYNEEYMRRYGVESGAMPVKQEDLIKLAESSYGAKPESTTAVASTSTAPSAPPPVSTEATPTGASTPSVTTAAPVEGATTASVTTATPTGASTPSVTTAAPVEGATTASVTTATPVTGATTPSVTTAATPTTPQSDTHPTKTMAQGGIIPKSADTQIVQRNRSGDIVSATKVGENENERMSIEPVSKMNADSLTKSSSNPVEADMIDSKAQSTPEDKKVSMQRQSAAVPRLSSDPYSNIHAEIKPMSPTAQAAMSRARDLSSDRRGYSIKQ